MEEIRVLIADAVPEARKNIKSYLSIEPMIKTVGECDDGEVTVKMAMELQPDIVILDIWLHGMDGITATETIIAENPNMLVILTTNRRGNRNLKKAMAAGAREFLPKPFSARLLVKTIVSLYERQKSSLDRIGKKDFKSIEIKPKVITVFSTKGGVGKTVIAANLAVSLAQKTGQKVALLDFDFEFGDIPIMFNLYPKRNILDLVNEIDNLDQDLLEEFLVEHESGVKILPAPPSPEYADYVSGQSAEKILKTFLKGYKYIVVDTAPAFREASLAALDAADHIFFVSTLDLHTIKNVKMGLQVMKGLKYEDSKVSLILNQYNRRFGISEGDLEKTLGKSVMHTIPEDRAAMIDAVNKGAPIVISKAGSPAAKSLREITSIIATGASQEKKPLMKRILSR